MLALATVLAVPLTFGLRAARRARCSASAAQQLTLLPVALASLRATTLRSLALAATGAVALFGSVALGGSRDDLLQRDPDASRTATRRRADLGHDPGDNQAVNPFRPGDDAAAIARLPGVARRAAPSMAASSTSAAAASG